MIVVLSGTMLIAVDRKTSPYIHSRSSPKGLRCTETCRIDLS